MTVMSAPDLRCLDDGSVDPPIAVPPLLTRWPLWLWLWWLWVPSKAFGMLPVVAVTGFEDDGSRAAGDSEF